MVPQSKAKNSKTVTGRPTTNWSTVSLEGSALFLSILKEAATFAPIAELKTAACTALFILQTIQTVKENKEAYERLGGDSSGLIAAIWRSFKKADASEDWLSAEMRDILKDLTHTLENICSFVQEQLSRNRAIRIIFSRADNVKINEYREHLNYTMQKFELQSHMNINEVLLQIMRKNDQLSEQVLYRNEVKEVNHPLNLKCDARDREIAENVHKEELGTFRGISKLERLKSVEIDCEAEDERWHSEELKKVERETKDRNTELERLRAAAGAVEEAKRLKKAEEEEIAQLKLSLAGNRQSIGAQNEKNLHQEDKRENWNSIVASEEEENYAVRKSSKAKRNRSRSPKTPPVVLEDWTDGEENLQHPKGKTARPKVSSASLRKDDLQSMRSSKLRIARRDLSNSSLRTQETQDIYTEEEDNYAPPPPKKAPKVKRKPQTSPANLPREVNDLTGQYQGFTTNPPWSGSGSPMYMPGINTSLYGPSFLPPMVPYGHGAGMLGTIINSGVGNITNTTISNVNNDNSVRKVYRQTRSQQRGYGN